MSEPAWQNRIVGEDLVDPATLKPNPLNWRKHPEHQRMAMAGVLSEIGWVQRVVVNKNTGVVVDGHLRRDMAEQKGEKVPVIYVDLSDDEERLVLATLDPIAALAETDADMLRGLVADVATDHEGLQAFINDIEVKVRDKGAGDHGMTDYDEIPDAPTEAVTQPGDVIQLGDHRLICGDATDAQAWATLIGEDSVGLIVTSPPYNVGIDYGVHDDEMSDADYIDLVASVAGNCHTFLDDGHFVAWNIAPTPKSLAPHHVIELGRVGLTYRRQIIWQKTGAGAPIFNHSVKARCSRNS
jgi:hypothetical protein